MRTRKNTLGLSRRYALKEGGTTLASPQARKVYNALAELSPAELGEVRSRCAAMLTLRGVTSSAPAITITDPHSEVDWLLCGIEEELRRRGVLGKTARLPAEAIYPRYRALATPARETLQHLLRQRARPAELAALGRLAGECLAEYVEQMHLPVTPRTMLQHAGEAAAALDACFPGYAAGGMVGLYLNNKN